MEFLQKTEYLDNDLETPVGFYLRQVGDKPGLLLESAEVDGRWGRYSLIACDFVLSLSCVEGRLSLEAEDKSLCPLMGLNGLPFIEGLERVMDAISLNGANGQPAITRGLYGYLGYGIAGMLEPKLEERLPPALAQACMVLPGTIYLFDHIYNKTCRITLYNQKYALTPISRRQETTCFLKKESPLSERANFIKAVELVKEMLKQGEAIQVVLSVPFSAPFKGDTFSLYRALRRINPSPYMFYMHIGDDSLLGSSPEVLVTSKNNCLSLCPIAGTRPRGKNSDEDALFGDELQEDPKEQAEHVMLVDLGRNDLGRVARPGTVKVERYMEVEKFSHVMHLSSRISAVLKPELKAMDILRAAFPAGTVSGAPKVRAMEIISDLEQSPRGPYAGAIGWLGLDKDAVHMDMGILIRSMWICEQTAHWQAGAGVVYDSDPAKEWIECLNKAGVIKEAILRTGS